MRRRRYVVGGVFLVGAAAGLFAVLTYAAISRAVEHLV